MNACLITRLSFSLIYLDRLSPQIASRSVLLGMIGGASIGALRQLQGELAEAKLQAVHQTS